MPGFHASVMSEYRLFPRIAEPVGCIIVARHAVTRSVLHVVTRRTQTSRLAAVGAGVPIDLELPGRRMKCAIYIGKRTVDERT